MVDKTKGQREQEQAMLADGLLQEEIDLLYEECREKLDEVESDLMDVIEDRVDVSPDFVNRVFRAFHSVKGAAAYLHHEPMKDLSHVAENVLAAVRDGKIVLICAHADVLLGAVSLLKQMASDVDRRLEIDYSEEKNRLAEILQPPVQGGAAVANPEPGREEQDERGAVHLKILVVEDDFTSRVVVQKLLARYGTVHIAINGREAVEAFKAAHAAEECYDLICMDIRMPEMDGMEAVRQIRALEEEKCVCAYGGIKIFMTTAVRDIKAVANSFKLLCDTYLFKPVDVHELEEHMAAFGLID